MQLLLEKKQEDKKRKKKKRRCTNPLYSFVNSREVKSRSDLFVARFCHRALSNLLFFCRSSFFVFVFQTRSKSVPGYNYTRYVLRAEKGQSVPKRTIEARPDYSPPR